MKPFTEWKVLPHGPLQTLDADILTVTGEIPMPLGNFERRMTIVRLADQRLVVFSAIALDVAGMRTIEEFGQPAFLIVPNEIHRLDAKVWKDRYPAMTVIAPAGGRENIAKIVPVDGTAADWNDPAVALVTIPGSGESELALEVRKPAGSTLVLNDLVGNVRNATGLTGWFLRLMRFAGDVPQIPHPVKWKLIKDKGLVTAELRRWAEMPALKRILVSHGEIIANDAPGTLRKLAASLS